MKSPLYAPLAGLALCALFAVPTTTTAQVSSDAPTAAAQSSTAAAGRVPSAAAGQVPTAAGRAPTAAGQVPTAAAGRVPAAAPPTQEQKPSTAGEQTPTTVSSADQTVMEQAPTITLFSREVDLIFTVTDHHGNFVTGLQQQDFGLLDDQRPPERVISFKQQTNLPLRVGVMLDTSSSIRQRFQFEQNAATDFLLQVLHPEDRAFVEGFDVQTDISQDFTNRVDLLDSGIRRLRPGGGTALYDSLYKTCRDQMRTLRQTINVRKAIVLVSDGDDDYSRALESDAIKMCQRAETIVFTISTDVSPSRDKGDDVLQQIADATGGRAFFPVRIEDVATGFHNIEVELRSQYSLIYEPADFKQNGSFRTIYLHCNDPHYIVNVKKGYFAPLPSPRLSP